MAKLLDRSGAGLWRGGARCGCALGFVVAVRRIGWSQGGVRGGLKRAPVIMGGRARFGRPARSQAGIAGGRCGRKVTMLTAGPGLAGAGRVLERAGGALTGWPA